jgi:hypothetical protein
VTTHSLLQYSASQPGFSTAMFWQPSRTHSMLREAGDCNRQQGHTFHQGQQATVSHISPQATGNSVTHFTTGNRQQCHIFTSLTTGILHRLKKKLNHKPLQNIVLFIFTNYRKQ